MNVNATETHADTATAAAPATGMTEEQVVALMSGSKTASEWNANADRVKKSCNGYPSFWYRSIVLSGVLTDTLGKDAGRLKIIAVR
jgi:hypothetical protein